MSGYEVLATGFDWWWIFPVGMIVLCIFMMRGGKCRMMCWPTSSDGEVRDSIDSSDSAKDILDKGYALGKISKVEYEEMKKDMSQ
jgi:uncharacterized membrane protein